MSLRICHIADLDGSILQLSDSLVAQGIAYRLLSSSAELRDSWVDVLVPAALTTEHLFGYLAMFGALFEDRHEPALPKPSADAREKIAARCESLLFKGVYDDFQGWTNLLHRWRSCLSDKDAVYRYTDHCMTTNKGLVWRCLGKAFEHIPDTKATGPLGDLHASLQVSTVMEGLAKLFRMKALRRFVDEEAASCPSEEFRAALLELLPPAAP